jgi:hypothetical protein
MLLLKFNNDLPSGVVLPTAATKRGPEGKLFLNAGTARDHYTPKAFVPVSSSICSPSVSAHFGVVADFHASLSQKWNV